MTAIVMMMLLLQSPAALDGPAPSVATRAQAWVVTAYPGLRHGDLLVTADGDAVTTRIVVGLRSASRDPRDTTAAPIAVTVDLHRSKVTGRLEVLAARGPLVHSADRAALADQITAHPEWTIDDVAAALMAAGARFGPDASASVLAELPPLGDLLGGETTLVGAAFVRTAPGGPLWRVEVASATRHYRLALEPFDGRLVGVEAR